MAAWTFRLRQAPRRWRRDAARAGAQPAAIRITTSTLRTMRSYLKAALTVSLFALVSGNAQAGFRLMSTDIHAGRAIPDAYTFNGMDCKGSNISPELHWQGAPAGTKSFALTMYDPDAPTGSGWWHWVVYNIPASATRLAAGAGEPGKNLLPKGSTMGNGDMGTAAYVGPCPPKGDKPHRSCSPCTRWTPIGSICHRERRRPMWDSTSTRTRLRRRR